MKKLLLLAPILVFFGCKTVPQKGEVSSRDKALAALESARSVKADVAAKDIFDPAFAAFNEAESLASSSPAEADKKYTTAETGFTSAYNRARDLRSAAQNELDKAKQEIRNAENDAAELEESRRAAEALEG
ncbi:MAG: hypothetical protein LBK64_04815 [Spirochaetaceae bacterium]|jgi:flagellar motility protein MotE (MotC chaperone)|nr:hypothetical protein [Spirochaetaceae bacterium]